jgi:hypothetical protein
MSSSQMFKSEFLANRKVSKTITQQRACYKKNPFDIACSGLFVRDLQMGFGLDDSIY